MLFTIYSYTDEANVSLTSLLVSVLKTTFRKHEDTHPTTGVM